MPDANRPLRRMEVAARIKELRAKQSEQPEPSPESAADPPAATPPATPAPGESEVAAAADSDQGAGSTVTTLADLLRQGGGLFS